MVVPDVRIESLNAEAVAPGGRYVLYWMTAHRRLHANFALDRALEHARELQRPLVILEGLRVGYRWASDRFHRFVLDGMAEKQKRLEGKPLLYYPYVEPEPGAGRGLLEALAEHAAVVVTDDYPCFFLPRMQAAAAKKIGVAMEAVDANGIMPLRATPKPFARAVDFRRFLQKNLPDHLDTFPAVDPLRRLTLPEPPELPAALRKRWPAAGPSLLDPEREGLAELPIDHDVAPVALRGGTDPARRRLGRFVDAVLGRYDEDRNRPLAEGTSGLSPYLHFGHLGSHEVFRAVMKTQDWSPGELSPVTRGQREGWWGVSSDAEAFLDQLVTWRELGFVFCHHRPDFARYDSLPDWAQTTLEEHAEDPRETTYGLASFEKAKTHDPLWNAAQNQLRREGIIHNYLRMLWGKKILEWSRSPREALRIMIELNNKYALDGRDPNSYSGIFWVLGRFDRAWGPERPIFGKIRYMSSDNTARKLRVKEYVERYAGE